MVLSFKSGFKFRKNLRGLGREHLAFFWALPFNHFFFKILPNAVTTLGDAVPFSFGASSVSLFETTPSVFGGGRRGGVWLLRMGNLRFVLVFCRLTVD